MTQGLTCALVFKILILIHTDTIKSEGDSAIFSLLTQLVVILLADQKVRSDNLVELALIYCNKASLKALKETASQAASFNLAKDCLHDQ